MEVERSRMKSAGEKGNREDGGKIGERKGKEERERGGKGERTEKECTEKGD